MWTYALPATLTLQSVTWPAYSSARGTKALDLYQSALHSLCLTCELVFERGELAIAAGGRGTPSVDWKNVRGAALHPPDNRVCSGCSGPFGSSVVPLSVLSGVWWILGATEPLRSSWVAYSSSTWRGVRILADAVDATSQMWKRLCLR